MVTLLSVRRTAPGTTLFVLIRVHSWFSTAWIRLRWPVSSKSERQSYKLRRLESYQHGLPILPLSVEVCTPVSETGRAGALPAVAANFYFNKEQTPPEGDKCRVSRERRLCFADDAFRYRLCYWACGS